MAFILFNLLTVLSGPQVHAQPAPGAQVEVVQALAAELTEEGSISSSLANAIGLQMMVLASTRKALRR